MTQFGPNMFAAIAELYDGAAMENWQYFYYLKVVDPVTNKPDLENSVYVRYIISNISDMSLTYENN